MMVMTTSISTSVMPEEPLPAGRGPEAAMLILPANEVGVEAVAAGLAVCAERSDVGLVTVFTRVFVDVVVAPGIFGNVFGHVGAGPLSRIGGLQAQRLQALFGG